MFNCYVVMYPEYNFKNLTKKQFKALKNYFEEHYDGTDRDLLSRDYKDHIECRGGKLTEDWYFVLSFNHIAYRRAFEECVTLEESWTLMNDILNYMDTIAGELNGMITTDDVEES